MMNRLAIGFLIVATVAHAMTDPATGIAFKPSIENREIVGVGVRKKGPIKVYSVGMYASQAVKDSLAGLSSDCKEARKKLRETAKATPTSFLLKMNFKVGAEKMASAIAESVAPRYGGSDSEVSELKSLIFNGVDGAATKGTEFQFDCSSGGLEVSVNGKKQGVVPSGGLAKAFCDVYLDDKAVSPSLRDSCLKTLCAKE